jgi:predicted Zn finger-like uncharacterized protein
MDILCPHCSQEYTVDDSRAGQVVQCAVCSDEFTIPAIEPTPVKTEIKPVVHTHPTPPSPSELPKNKVCPMCGETILYSAKKCRFCQTMLDGERVIKQVDRMVYVLLAIFMGGLGVHNFYAGRTGAGYINLALTLFALPTFGVTAFMNFIMIVCDIIVDPNDRVDTKKSLLDILIIVSAAILGLIVTLTFFNVRW